MDDEKKQEQTKPAVPSDEDIRTGNFNCINYETFMAYLRRTGQRQPEPEQPPK